MDAIEAWAAGGPEFLKVEVMGNSVLRILVISISALLVSTAGLYVLRSVGRRLQRLADRTDTLWDDVLAKMLGAVKGPLFLGIALCWISLGLKSPPLVDQVAHGVFTVLVLLQVGIVLRTGLRGGLEAWRAQSESSNPTLLAAIGFVGSVVIWSVLVIVGLSSFGVEISALVAGLGVGGVAAALAVQSLLGDVFSAVSLYTDRPFDVGDFVALGTDVGTVRHVGWRTTRIDALSGEHLVISNSDMTGSRIRNFTRMKERRIVFRMGLLYSTPLEALKQVPGWVKSIVEATEGTRFDRCHLIEFADSALSFETVYFVLSRDFNVYVELNQKILLGILDKLEAEGLSIAFPTRTLHVEGLQALAPSSSTPNG